MTSTLPVVSERTVTSPGSIDVETSTRRSGSIAGEEATSEPMSRFQRTRPLFIEIARNIPPIVWT